MFYRYEAKERNSDDDYEGIFSFFDPDERRYFGRFLREPKWYKNNPGVDSRCWFTEEGYIKYHKIVEELISDKINLDVRLLKKETIGNIVCKGKIQCIERVN